MLKRFAKQALLWIGFPLDETGCNGPAQTHQNDDDSDKRFTHGLILPFAIWKRYGEVENAEIAHCLSLLAVAHSFGNIVATLFAAIIVLLLIKKVCDSSRFSSV